MLYFPLSYHVRCIQVPTVLAIGNGPLVSKVRGKKTRQLRQFLSHKTLILAKKLNEYGPNEMSLALI